MNQILFNQAGTNGHFQPFKINPNLYSNLELLLTIYGLNPNLNKEVEVKKDAKDKSYWELLYKDKFSDLLYDYISIPNSIQNPDSNNYIIEKDPYVSYIIPNDKRFTYFGESYIIEPKINNPLFPPKKYIPFKYLQNEYSPLKLTATLKGLSGEAYVESTVDRFSCFVFKPSSTVFLLVNKSGDNSTKKIYAMQTWTNKTYTELDSATNMFYLQTVLSDPVIVGENVLPENWIFVNCILDEEYMIALFSNPDMGINAKVISDGIGNSYQYVRYEEAPFLYDLKF